MSVFELEPKSGRRSTRRFHAGGIGLIAACLALCVARSQAGSAEELQIPDGFYRIAGTVVNAKNGAPLARCRVTIIDTKDRQHTKFVIGGDDGRFEFYVPPGKYSLEGAKRGFIRAAYNQHDQFSTAIVTGADLDTENLVLRLPAEAVLTGRVLDESGEPVRTAQIRIYREEHALGVSRTSVYRSAMTDDQGRYEAARLQEGIYFVSAKASPWYAVHPPSNPEASANTPAQVDSALDVAYPITYYGDATEAEDATPIPIRGGDRLEADIHLNPAPAVHLLVRVPNGGDFPVLSKPAFDGAEELQGHDVESVAPGLYELSGIAAGRYTVRIPDAGGQTKESEVEVNGAGELDTAAGRSTSKIKATVQIAGGASAGEELQIFLRNSKGKRMAAQVDGKGEANFSDVASGKYDILAGSAGQPFTVTRIASEGDTNSGHSLNVPVGASLSVVLTLAAGSVTVEGFAMRDGNPVAGAMIVLVPKSDADYDRIRRDESNLDGSFSLRDVIPGTYTVVAIENGWDLEWAQPGVLAQYLKRGQTVEAEGRSAVHPANSVYVQTK